MCAAMTGREAYRVMFRDYPDVVTVEQMSRMLGISDKTAYALLRDNTQRSTRSVLVFRRLRLFR